MKIELKQLSIKAAWYRPSPLVHRNERTNHYHEKGVEHLLNGRLKMIQIQSHCNQITLWSNVTRRQPMKLNLIRKRRFMKHLIPPFALSLSSSIYETKPYSSYIENLVIE